jgi:Tfp pilus assembly protein PilO
MGVLDPIVYAPRPYKLILGATTLVIIGVLGYFFLISGVRAQRDTLQEENNVRRAEVLKAKADEATLRQFGPQAAALRKRLETAKERLPTEREIPQVYRQVSDLAARSGLGVSLFQPKRPRTGKSCRVPIAVTAQCTSSVVLSGEGKISRLAGRVP